MARKIQKKTTKRVAQSPLIKLRGGNGGSLTNISPSDTKVPSPLKIMGRHEKLISNARQLRHNATEAENKIWQYLRQKQTGYRFYRQYVFDDKYILDFYCAKKKLVLEIDGGQHNQNADDKVRDAYLNNRGCQILRLWNNDVLNNIEGCWDMIERALSSPNPLLKS